MKSINLAHQPATQRVLVLCLSRLLRSCGRRQEPSLRLWPLAALASGKLRISGYRILAPHPPSESYEPINRQSCPGLTLMRERIQGPLKGHTGMDDSDPDPGPPLAWNPRIALATLWPPLTARLHYPSLHTPCHGSAPLKTTQPARLTSPGPTRLGCSGPLPRSLPSFMSVCPLNPRARSLPSLPR